MASVRFICGAQTLHRELEQAIARYLGKDDAILFAACFDANGGVFEPLLGAEDAIISDALNHASIIDGMRLCKAKRYRFANRDMDELEDRLKQAAADGARFKLIATDGVFSMDGYVAKLAGDLRPRRALRRDRDGRRLPCHRPSRRKGRGTPALTGAGERHRHRHRHVRQDARRRHGRLHRRRQPVIDLLRQRARPYLFSNCLAPPVAAGALKAIEIAGRADDRRARLHATDAPVSRRHDRRPASSSCPARRRSSR